MFLTLLMLLSGCAGLRTDYEQPTVGLQSFRLLPSDTLVPRFEIGLHLINPNRDPLPLKGIHYSIRLEEHKVLTGVANDLPTIAPYGEEDVVIVASVDLLGGMKLLQTLLQETRSSLSYVFEAKLDVGRLAPVIRIKEEGDLSIQDSL